MDNLKVSNQTINALFTFVSQLQNTVIWLCSADYQKQLYVSDNFEKIWGVSKDTLYTNMAVWPNTLIPEDLSKIGDELKLRSIEANRCSTINFRIHRPDGELRYLKSTGFTLYDNNGKPNAIIGIDENLTADQWHQSTTIPTQPLPLLTDLSKVITNELKIALPENTIATDMRSGKAIPLLPKKLNINNKVVNLTEREMQCLAYLIQGKSAKETAYYLNISTRTVETYLDNLRHKTNCRTKIELIGKLQQQG